MADALLNVLMAVLPSSIYIPQYSEMSKSRSSKGFASGASCCILLSNITRLFYWFGEPFEMTLVIQALIMIIAQLLLMEIVVRYSDSKAFSNNGPIWNQFWQWPTFLPYVLFLVAYTGILSVLTNFMLTTFDSSSSVRWTFVQILGIVAMAFEAALAVPQVLNNAKRKSTQGLSLTLVAGWCAGDLFKTIYFIMKNQPLPFIVCGVLQCIIDVIIVIQLFIYQPYDA